VVELTRLFSRSPSTWRTRAFVTLLSMGEGRSGGRQIPPMNSQVNWSLLGLVIKRPSYAYELAQRFERTYEHVVSLSSVSHIYTALAGLKDRSLIEQTAGAGTAAQRKPIYKATKHGIEEYRRWLLGTPGEDRRRQQLFVLQLAALMSPPDAAVGILRDYERECEEQRAKAHARGKTNETVEANGGLVARLLAEEQRLVLDAKLAWARYAQRELEAFGQATAHRQEIETSLRDENPAQERADLSGRVGRALSSTPDRDRGLSRDDLSGVAEKVARADGSALSCAVHGS